MLIKKKSLHIYINFKQTDYITTGKLQLEHIH